jgi:nucleoside-diphosphate-sugar epimerase
MRILLIGATGFIGPHVISVLNAAGHDLAVFSRSTPAAAAGPPPYQHIRGDRRRLVDSRAALRAFSPDVVVDLILSSAAQAHDVIEVFRGCADRVVILSSMDVYRACGVLHALEPGHLDPLPLTESSALRTRLQTYPPAQIAMLQQVFGWVDDEYDKIPVERTIAGDPGLPATVLRLPMVYGPGDPLHRFYPVVKRIVDGRPVIPIPADVAAWRGTKGYVENVAAAIALAATTPRAAGQIYNVGDPDTLTELEWTRLIAHTAGWTGEIAVLPPDRAPEHLRMPGNLSQHWVADTTRIRDELRYRESVPRAEAVRRTIEWERQHPPDGFTPHQIDYAAEDAAV